MILGTETPINYKTVSINYLIGRDFRRTKSSKIEMEFLICEIGFPGNQDFVNRQN